MVADQQDALLDFSGLATGKIGYRVFLKAILNFLPSFCSVTLCGKVAKNPTNDFCELFLVLNDLLQYVHLNVFDESNFL